MWVSISMACLTVLQSSHNRVNGTKETIAAWGQKTRNRSRTPPYILRSIHGIAVLTLLQSRGEPEYVTMRHCCPTYNCSHEGRPNTPPYGTAAVHTVVAREKKRCQYGGTVPGTVLKTEVARGGGIETVECHHSLYTIVGTHYVRNKGACANPWLIALI